MNVENELPKSNIKRIVKRKLEELDTEERKRHSSLNKDLLAAFAETTKIFLHNITTTAAELCQSSKRSTISPEHVIDALNELEFREFIDALKIDLEGLI